MVKKCAALLFSFILLYTTADAQVRKYSNEFLSIGISARSLAMAGATVATVNDVGGTYWNPAGLMGIKSDIQIGLMHSEYFAGIAKFDYGAVAVPLNNKNHFLAVSMIRFGVDDIPNTLFLFEEDGSINYDNITSFSVADYAFMVSYARQLKPKGLNVGGSVKVIHRNAGSFATAWGFGLDLGMQYKVKNWHFGVMLRDITTTFNAWSFSFEDDEKEILEQTGNEIPQSSYEITPPKIIWGAAYNWQISDKFNLLTEVNFDMTTDGKRNVLISGAPISLDPHFGIEVGFADLIYLRGGIGNIQKATSDEDESEKYIVQPNLGLGINIKGVTIDYAFTNISNQSQLLYSHVFSLTIDINKKSKKVDGV